MQEEQNTPSFEQQKIYLAIWEKAVDTQMHFNEMSVKARQFGLTFVAAALGLGVVLQTRAQDFVIPVHWGGFEIHAIVLLVLAGAFALFAVRVLDLNVYHRMLRGAVTFGEDFETNYMSQIFSLEKGMTQAISFYSRYGDAKVEATSSRYRYVGKKRSSAERKVRWFYRIAITVLILIAAGLFIATNHFGQLQPPSSDAARHTNEP